MAVVFTGAAASFRILGAAATTHNLFSIENQSGSNRLVKIRKLVCQLDATAALTAVMPLVKVSRPSSLPTGGTVLSKQAFNTTQSSASQVVIRAASASDGGSATAITATAGDTIWQQYCMRLHTAAGQVLALDNSLLPTFIESTPFILRPNESLLVQVVAAAGTSNPNTNHWFVQCVWEEDDNI
jgi:hypothetical protein